MCLVLTCFSLFCTLLLPSGLCGCLFCHIIEFILHAALAVGASRVLVCQLLYLSLSCVLLLLSGFCRYVLENLLCDGLFSM